MQSDNKFQIPDKMELEVTCYLTRREGGRASCYAGDAFLMKQFCVEIAVSGPQEGTCTPLTTTVCRKCREVLLHEISLSLPSLGREERGRQVEFLLNHRPRDKSSGFRVVALFAGSGPGLCLPREEESCPLCEFALSPFDRASSLSEQSLSRGYSPPAARRDPPRRTAISDAPFATQVTPQGDVVKRKPRAGCSRQDFVSPSDLQVKPRGGQESGIHRHVSLTVSNFKYSPVSHNFPRRPKSSCQTHRSRTGAEEDRLHTLKKGLLLQKHRPRPAPSVSLHELGPPSQVKSCRVM